MPNGVATGGLISPDFKRNAAAENDSIIRPRRGINPKSPPTSRLGPSEYFAAGIYTTFQDDLVAFQSVEMMNWKRLMWANDFPHSDSTWPWSQDVIAEQTAHLTPELKKRILRDNVAELYKLAA